MPSDKTTIIAKLKQGAIRARMARESAQKESAVRAQGEPQNPLPGRVPGQLSGGSAGQLER